MTIKLSKIILEIADFLAVIALAVASYSFNAQKPWFNTYVSCHDERYRHPILQDDEHLVSRWTLLIGVLLVLPISFYVIEAILTVVFPRTERGNAERKPLKTFFELLHTLGLYYSGLFFVTMVSKISQAIGGNPAPYFLTLCSPGCSNATDSFLDSATKRLYITLESCRSERVDILSSFPCMHAMYSFYGAAFVTVHNLYQKPVSYTRLLRPYVAIVAIVLAMVTSISRVREYSNHGIDVIAGAAIGCVVACIHVLIL